MNVGTTLETNARFNEAIFSFRAALIKPLNLNPAGTYRLAHGAIASQRQDGDQIGSDLSLV